MRWRSLTPSEHQEQSAVIDWTETQRSRLPEAALIFAIPNGGGVKRGVPDLFLPVARQEWHGLFVEMKRIKNSFTSFEQDLWIAALTAQGYAVSVCRGAEDAIDSIRGYLTLSTWSPRRRHI